MDMNHFSDAGHFCRTVTCKSGETSSRAPRALVFWEESSYSEKKGEPKGLEIPLEEDRTGEETETGIQSRVLETREQH